MSDARLPIHFTPVADVKHHDLLRLVINVVNDAIVSGSDAPAFGVDKLHATMRTWLLSQRLNS